MPRIPCHFQCPPPTGAQVKPFPFNVVAFDLDGTLADTAPDLAADAVIDDYGELVRTLEGL